MYLNVDISDFVYQIFWQLFSILSQWFDTMHHIIIFDSSRWGVSDSFQVSLLDFCIGILVVSIILGALLRLTKADEFYANRW